MQMKLATQNIRAIATFERVTRVQPKDCIIAENSIYFLVDPKKVGLAIGKNGSVIRELRRIFGKNIKVYGYSRDPKTLLENIIPNIKSIEIKNNSITISVPMEDRTIVIGKNGENIKTLRKILKRHFAINNLRLRK